MRRRGCSGIGLVLVSVALFVLQGCGRDRDIRSLNAENAELCRRLTQAEAAKQRQEAISKAEREFRDTYTRYLSNIMGRLREMSGEEAAVLEMVSDVEFSGAGAVTFDVVEAETRLASIETKLSLNQEEIARLESILRQAQEAEAGTAAYIENLLETVRDLNSELEEKKRTIVRLRSSVDLLTIQVNDLEAENRQVRQENAQLRDWLSAWILPGSKKRLRDLTKAGQLIEVRGTYAPSAVCLRSGNYARHFSELGSDQRSRISLPPGTRKIEVRSVHRFEENLYRFNGNPRDPWLEIVDPDQFWALSPFLVIQTK